MALPYKVNIDLDIFNTDVDYDFKNDFIYSAIQNLVYEREEEILACMAAGVPANCIAFTRPSETFNFNQPEISLGFKFIGDV